MGSMPRLKLKDEYQYRKGSTDESQNCRRCVNFVPQKPTDIFHVIDEGRCKIFGLKESSRYRVRASMKCDRQEYAR